VLSDLGIGAALIYHREDEKTNDTAFILNLFAGVLLCGITLLLAPLAGEFFNDPRAIPVTRALSFTFPLTALGNIHDSLLRKNLTFKRKFIPDVVKAVGKGVISIVLALMGFGYWSLIIGQLGGTAVAVIAYWAVHPWRPTFRFDKTIARSLLSYGSKIVAVTAIGVFLLNVDYLFVGRFLGAAALGVYTLAFRIPELLIKQFSGILGQALFPAYVKLRDNAEALHRGFLLTMRYVTMVTIPLGLGLALVSEPLVLTLFTDKWAEAIDVIPAIATYTLIRSITQNIGHLFKAQGRPEILTKLSVLQAFVLLPALWWAVTGPATIAAVAWMQVASASFNSIITIIVAARMLNTPIRTMLATLQPTVIGGGIMTAAVLGILSLTTGLIPVLRLITAVSVGALAYGGALWWLQREVVITASARLRAAFGKS
jgi:O-antigen/teichoic acid export membrane protein